MKNRSIRVLVLPVGGRAYECSVGNDLVALQRLVEGNLECAHLDGDFRNGGVDLWLNEDAVGLDLPDNRPAPRSIAPAFIRGVIQGPAFVARVDDEGDIVDLTDADVAKWTGVFG